MKPTIKKNKFKNLTKKDWKESNKSSKDSRGISSIAYSDVYQIPHLSVVNGSVQIDDNDPLQKKWFEEFKK
jgi:hypothetical protein